MPYSKRRVDLIQPTVVKMFRMLGASVEHLHSVGDGCPDICVGFRGVCYMVEIKSGNKKKLTDDQVKWASQWKGSFDVVMSLYDVEALIKKWSNLKAN